MVEIAYVLLFLATAGLAALPFLLDWLGHPSPGAEPIARIGGLVSLFSRPSRRAARRITDMGGTLARPFLDMPLIAGGLVYWCSDWMRSAAACATSLPRCRASTWLPSVRQTVQKRRERRPHGFALHLAHRLRTAQNLNDMGRFFNRTALPVALLLLLLAGALLAAHRVGVALRTEVFGLCVPTAAMPAAHTEFHPSNPCWASGRVLVQGERYRLRLEMTEAFRDRSLASGVGGFRSAGWIYRLAAPFRRWSWGAAWSQPIARIGHSAGTEWALPGPVPLADPRPAA